MDKVLIGDGCWLWTGARSGKYGEIWDGDKRLRAHRIAYETFRGEIPQGMELDHLCRTYLCVHPDHLETVTRRQNLQRIKGTDEVCKRGHSRKEHAYTSPDGHTRCRICNRLRADA
jgi:hypothetical protein